jgi:transposase InsO family protein
MTAQLRREGFQVNHKRVLRLMRVANLRCQTKRRFVRTTDSKHDFRLYPNLTKELELTKINQLWVADITYIHVREGFAYLAVILDAFSRRVVSWALSRHIDSELTVAAAVCGAGLVNLPQGVFITQTVACNMLRLSMLS